MFYLIVQIILCLLLAFILGFLLGWLLKIFPKRSKVEEIGNKLQSLENQTNSFSNSYNERLDKLKAEISSLRTFCSEGINKTTPSGTMEADNSIDFAPGLAETAESDTSASMDSQSKIKNYDVSSAIKDDLKKISGVGPFLEKFLNDFGIFTFKQVAELSEEKIDEISQKLDAFKGRIERDDWTGQARALYFDKYGEQI